MSTKQLNLTMPSLSSSLSPHHLFANSFFALFFFGSFGLKMCQKTATAGNNNNKTNKQASISLTTTRVLLLTDRQGLQKKSWVRFSSWLCTPFCFAPVTYLFNFPVLLVPSSLPPVALVPFLSSRSQEKTTKQLGPCPQLNPPSDAQNNTNQTNDARPRSVPSYLSLFSFPFYLRWWRVLFHLPLLLTFSHSSFFFKVMARDN